MDTVKAEAILMSSGALEIVLRCAACHEPVWVPASNWTDAYLHECQHCHAPWKTDASAERVGRALAMALDLPARSTCLSSPESAPFRP
jgi:hypothetical protein